MSTFSNHITNYFPISKGIQFDNGVNISFIKIDKSYFDLKMLQSQNDSEIISSIPLKYNLYNCFEIFLKNL